MAEMAIIYYTSDVHSYLYPVNYISGRVEAMGYAAISSRFADADLILDGGDSLQGSPLVSYELRHGIKELSAAKLYNAAGLSVYVPGNHDFNFGPERLRSFLASLDADIVAANVEGIGAKPYVLKETEDGTRLFITGVVTDYVNIWDKGPHLEGLKVTDCVQQAEEAIKESRRLSPDFTICIYHGGFGEETGAVKENRGEELSRLGFSLLLTAHQHAVIPPRTVNGTLTLQAGCKGALAARIELSRGKEIKAELVKADTSLPLLPAVKAVLDQDRVHEKVLASLDSVIARGRLEDKSKLDSALHGSSLADFFNDVQLEFSGADVSAAALVNDPVSLGPEITLGQLFAAYPFSNTLTKLRINGRMLKQAVENSALYFTLKDGKIAISDRFLWPKREHYNYDFYRGIDYEITVSREPGDRVTRLRLGGIDLLQHPESELTIVLNSYRATGTGGYAAYREGETVEKYAADVQDLLRERLESHGTVPVPEPSCYSVVP